MVTVVWMALLAVMADPQAEPISPDNPTISVAGAIVGSDSKPLADAEVVLRAQIGGHFYSMGLRTNRDVLARTRADKEGKFRFEKVGIPPRMVTTFEQLDKGKGGVEIVAWAPGHVLKWQTVSRFENREPLRLSLQPEAEVIGVVQDVDGKPLPNVKVRMLGASTNRDRNDGTFRQPDELNLVLSGVTIGTETDQEGRFRLPHAPRNGCLGISVIGPGYRQQYSVVDTGSEPYLKEVKEEGSSRPGLTVKHSPLSIPLAKQRTITIRVTDHAGQPVTDGGVMLTGISRNRIVEDTLDAKGEVELAVLEGDRLSVQYINDPLQPRFSKSDSVAVPAGNRNFQFDLQLPKPIWITGKIVDDEHGRSIAGAYVMYHNETVSGAPEQSAYATAVSQKEGIFRLPILPGKGRITVSLPILGFFVPDRRDAASPKDGVVVDSASPDQIIQLNLSRGLVISGVLKDAAGQPVTDAVISARNLESPYVARTTRTNAAGAYEVAGFSPGVDVVLTSLAKEGSATAIVKGDPKASLSQQRNVTADLNLKTGVILSGRIVEDGKPQAGVRLGVTCSLSGLGDVRHLELGEVQTDENGVFRVGGFSPGDQYYFEIRAGQNKHAIGWHHQMPYMMTVGEGPVIALPDAVLVPHGQRLSGVVVDPDGKPVAGITVSAQAPSGGSLPLRNPAPPPWTETDKEGKFALTHLPDMPLELMAYKHNPAGGPIKYPAKVKAKLNQTDIRIILDPKLDDKAEDLDAPQK